MSKPFNSISIDNDRFDIIEQEKERIWEEQYFCEVLTFQLFPHKSNTPLEEKQMTRADAAELNKKLDAKGLFSRWEEKIPAYSKPITEYPF